MANLNNFGIMIDSVIDVTGLSPASQKKIKASIADAIKGSSELSLSFDKAGKTAILNDLQTVWDGVNKINKMTANLKIGDTSYKVSINDYAERLKETLSLNNKITKEEEKQKNLIQQKKTANNEEKKSLEKQIKLSQEKTSELREQRQLTAAPIMKEKYGRRDDKGKFNYSDKSFEASNLKRTNVTRVTSKTNFDTLEAQLKQYYKDAVFYEKGYQEAVKKGLKDRQTFYDNNRKKMDKAIEKKEAELQKETNKDIKDKFVKEQGFEYRTTKIKTKDVIAETHEKDKNEQLARYIQLLKEREKATATLVATELKMSSGAEKRSQENKDLINYTQDMIDAQTKEMQTIEESIKGSAQASKAADELAQSQKRVEMNTKIATAEHSKSNNILSIMGENFKKAAAKIIDYTLVYRSLWLVMQKFQQAVQTVIDLNKAFTDIQIVTGYTDNQMQGLAETMATLAKETGATLDQVAEAATEWLRQGKSVAETNYLIQQSMIASKIGMLDEAQSVEILTSTLNGFNMTVSDASRIVDVFSNLD